MFFSERFLLAPYKTNELRTLEFSSLLHSLGRSDSSLMALDVGELGFVRASQVTRRRLGRPVGCLLAWWIGAFLLFGLKFGKKVGFKRGT